MSNTEKNRILLLNSLPIYGGGEFFVYLLSKKLKSNRWDVHVSCLKDTELYCKCEDENIKVFPVKYPVDNYRGVFKIARQISTYIKEHNINLVHSNTNYDRTAGAIAAKMAGIKHITNIHSYHSIQHNITHYLRNRMMTDRFIADGISIKNLLVEKDKIDQNKISVLNLGIEPVGFDKQLSRKRIRAEFELNYDEIIIGNAARMVPFKGQEYLLRAFSNISPYLPNAKILVIGDGELMEMLKNLAEELKISSKVIFAGFRKDIYEVFTALDIYAHTSVEGGGEAFPFALLHALEQALPLVITDAGDMKIMVKNEYNGFLCKEKDIAQIAGSLGILIENDTLRRQMGKNSFELFNKEFTADIMTTKIEKIYNEVLGIV
jgi:glycosyltransferase involved in cell wall biosynthesis